MVKEKKQLNLHQKLIEIRKAVDYLQKAANGFKYKYVADHQILALIRPVMDDLNVLLEFEMEPLTCLEKETRTHNTRESLTDKQGNPCEKVHDSTSETPYFQATFVFTFVNADNPEQQIVKRLYIPYRGADVKEMGGLCTYASRYFLLKYFNIPTDNMDPDNFAQTTCRVSPDMVSDYNAIITELEKHDQELAESLVNRAKAHYKFTSVDKMKPESFVEMIGHFQTKLDELRKGVK